MPEMPSGDPWVSIGHVLEAERRIRLGEHLDPDTLNVAPYWSDIVRLLQVFDATGDEQRIDALSSAMDCKRYKPFIDGRRTLKPLSPRDPKQRSLRL